MAATIDEISALTRPSEDYLCNLRDNSFCLQFLAFRLSDAETNEIYFQLENEELSSAAMLIDDANIGEEEKKYIKEARRIEYVFPKKVLEREHISSFVRFKVGDRPVNELVLLEKHFYKDELLKEFKFTFPFCAPDSTNTWEFVYSLPKLTPTQAADIIANPNIVTSDTYLFVEGKLIIHNKVFYTYV